MSKKYFIDDFIEQMKDGSICTSIPSCDLYDKLKDKPYYNKYEDIYYESEEIGEEGINNLVKEQEEKFEFIKGLDFEEYYFNSQEENDSENDYDSEDDDEDNICNPYTLPSKHRYDNRKKDLDCKCIYMYEVYERLNELNVEDDFCMLDVQELINDLENEAIEGTVYNIQSTNIFDLIEDLKLFIDDYICHLESDYSYLESAKDFKKHIINKYFGYKGKSYQINRAIKKKYLKIINSDEYKNKKIDRKDIAKIIGCSLEEIIKLEVNIRKKKNK